MEVYEMWPKPHFSSIFMSEDDGISTWLKLWTL